MNGALSSGARAIIADPYGPGCLVEVRPSDPGEADPLLSAEEYEAAIKA